MPDPIHTPDSYTERRAARGAGGTPGGFGSFFVGLGMMLVGAYLILNQVVVHSHFSIWGFPGSNGGGFGPLLIALMIGVGILFFNAKSILGWLITAGAAVTLVVSLVINLDLFFRPTTLWMTLVMFGLLSAGFGLIVRSFRAFPSEQ